MKAKFVLISTLYLCVICLPLAQAMTVSGNTVGSQAKVDQNRMSGVVSKIASSQIEINRVVYDFNPNLVHIYDLNGLPYQKAHISIGTFVNFVVGNDREKARIVELRVIRK